ncbi:MAG: META domain-containing protein [Candidatus Limnocylindrales bacterium]
MASRLDWVRRLPPGAPALIEVPEMTESANQPTSLEGVTWHLTRGVAVPGDGTTISARFVGGTVAGSGGAGRYRADYRVAGSGLTLGPPASTASSGDAQHLRTERDYFAMLAAVAEYRVDPVARMLSLSDSSGGEILAFAVAPDVGSGLAGRWDVRSVRRGDGDTPSAAEGGAYLIFAEAGEVTGSGGVNQIHGPARADGDRLHLGPLATTRMVGPADATDRETALLTALDGVAAYRLEAEDGLVLLDADGEPLVRLTRSTQRDDLA